MQHRIKRNRVCGNIYQTREQVPNTETTRGLALLTSPSLFICWDDNGDAEQKITPRSAHRFRTAGQTEKLRCRRLPLSPAERETARVTWHRRHVEEILTAGGRGQRAGSIREALLTSPPPGRQLLKKIAGLAGWRTVSVSLAESDPWAQVKAGSQLGPNLRVTRRC